MNNMLPIKEYSVDFALLSQVELQILKKLIDAAKLIAPIYHKQENKQYLGANFFPHDINKEEIAQYAENNAEILSPYTMVIRNDSGTISAIPYHIYFHDDLIPIVQLLKEAASLTDNKAFARCLLAQADALMNGTYDKADVNWLKMGQYKIDIIIGPLERFDDQLFFRKNSYTATVGIMDKQDTKRAKLFKNVIHASTRKSFTPQTKVEFLDKVHVRVDNIVIFSGLDAEAMFNEADLPNDPAMMQKHGVEIILFKTAIQENFDTKYYPLARKIFDEEFFKNYDRKEFLYQAVFDNSVINGVTNCLMRYTDAEERLKEHFPVISKLASYTMGVKNCRPLLLEDVISQEQIEAMLLMFIVRGYTWWIDYLRQKTVYYHTIANAIALNYLLERGAIHIQGDISWPNFMKTFVSCEELSEVALHILAVGTYEEADMLIKSYGSFAVFEKLHDTLMQFTG